MMKWTEEQWNQFWALFHKAWGISKESPEYDKNVFNEMQQMLQKREAIDVRPKELYYKGGWGLPTV